ncbi:Tyrosine recombinase XerC, partial [termite gut metagenome]
MLKYAKDGVSVVLTLDTRREKKDGLFPVKIQVVQNG